MFNGKVKSIQYIIEKVFRDTGVVEGVDLYDCVEWAAECMELIGAPQSYSDVVSTIDIVEGKGELPCNLHLIIQTRVVTDGGYLPMKYATNTFHSKTHCKDSKDLTCGSQATYTLNNNYIFTGFNEGTVEIAYKAFATDENGWPTIPDDIKFVKAVEFYIREKIDYKLARVGKLPFNIYEKTVQEQLWYLGAAQTRGAMPSVDMMENIKNNWLRLIPKINQHEDFFSSFGEPEKRTVRNTSNTSTGAASDAGDIFADL